MQDSLIEKIKPYIKNYDAYLVGGYLRDLLSGEISPDRDIAIKCDNLAKLTKKIADELNGSFVELDPVNEIYRVVFGEDYIDFAKLLNNNLDDDIKRRDFTINAIMYDINNEKFVDITGGKKDFEEKIIRTYKISNLSDDPLRTLRAIRFQAKFGFRIDDEIVNFIKENNSLILNVAPERVHQELIKTFEGKFLINALFSMDETGLLDVIFPFFKDIKKIPSNSHHHLDLFHHLIETTKNIRINKPELKLAAFIHDLAKPDCWTIEPETGRHRFISHDELGANDGAQCEDGAHREIDAVGEDDTGHAHGNQAIKGSLAQQVSKVAGLAEICVDGAKEYDQHNQGDKRAVLTDYRTDFLGALGCRCSIFHAKHPPVAKVMTFS